MDHLKIGSLEWYQSELREKDFIIQRLKKQVQWLQEECAKSNKDWRSLSEYCSAVENEKDLIFKQALDFKKQLNNFSR